MGDRPLTDGTGSRSRAGTAARRSHNGAARAKGGGDESTRQAVINAALTCICDRGFYRASSNEIARHAGVSWGVIQHYFGTRDALLIAVLEDAVSRAIDSLDNADLVGDTLEERLGSLFDLMLAFFGRREYLAVMQIMWNLGRDPEAGGRASAAHDEFVRRLEIPWRSAVRSAVGFDAPDDTVGMVFTMLWGAALQQAFTDLMPPTTTKSVNPAVRRRMVVHAVRALLAGDAEAVPVRS
jgi:AcrR family transcriptional regulator